MVTVMVVDDENAILGFFNKALTRFGYDVVTGSNGKEALDLFSKNKIDAVFTDFSMPVMDGLTLAINIKNQFPETPVIMMTGQGKDVVLDQIKNKHIDLLLEKPVSLEVIMASLNSVLKGNYFKNAGNF